MLGHLLLPLAHMNCMEEKINAVWHFLQFSTFPCHGIYVSATGDILEKESYHCAPTAVTVSKTWSNTLIIGHFFMLGCGFLKNLILASENKASFWFYRTPSSTSKSSNFWKSNAINFPLLKEPCTPCSYQPQQQQHKHRDVEMTLHVQHQYNASLLLTTLPPADFCQQFRII